MNFTILPYSTLPEKNITNIAPKSGWLVDKIDKMSFWHGLFSRAAFSFRECNFFANIIQASKAKRDIEKLGSLSSEP